MYLGRGSDCGVGYDSNLTVCAQSIRQFILDINVRTIPDVLRASRVVQAREQMRVNWGPHDIPGTSWTALEVDGYDSAYGLPASLVLLPTVFEHVYAVLTGNRVNGVRDGVNVCVSLAEESSRCLEADQSTSHIALTSIELSFVKQDCCVHEA